MNLPNTLTVARIFLVPLLVSVLLTKFEGRLVLGLPVELVAGGHLRHRLADRLARRLSRAAPQAGHDARPDPRSARRQAADLRHADLARAAQSRAVVDGRRDHRPRDRGDRPPQPRLLARPDDAGLGPRQAQDGVAGDGDPAADSRVGAHADAGGGGAGGDVGGAGHRAGLRGRLLPGIPARDDQPRARKSPTSKRRSRRERRRSRERDCDCWQRRGAAPRRRRARSPSTVVRHDDLRGLLARRSSPPRRPRRPAAGRCGSRDRSRSDAPATTPCAVPRSIENTSPAPNITRLSTPNRTLRAIGEVRLRSAPTPSLGSGTLDVRLEEVAGLDRVAREVDRARARCISSMAMTVTQPVTRRSP